MKCDPIPRLEPLHRHYAGMPCGAAVAAAGFCGKPAMLCFRWADLDWLLCDEHARDEVERGAVLPPLD